jgi:protein TonB
MNTKKQNSNIKKETPNSKLQKSSLIFMQLGLILALLAVYVTLEHKSLVKYAILDESVEYDPYDESVIDVVEIEIEEPPVYSQPILPEIPESAPQTPDNLDNLNIVENNTPEIETKVNPTEVEPDEPVIITPKKPVTVVKVKKPISTINNNFVKMVPSFPG